MIAPFIWLRRGLKVCCDNYAHKRQRNQSSADVVHVAERAVIPAAEWRTRGRHVQLMGREIFTVDSGGAGPVVLMIHGFPTASWDWSEIWDDLARDHRLVAADMLGFGFSEKPLRHRYTIHEQADLMEALVRAIGLDRFHVLAHDYGDTVAQEMLARQNEERGAGTWLSVCLLNGGLFPETHRARLVQKLLLTPLGPWISRLNSRRSFARSFAKVFGADTQPTPAQLDAFWELIEYNDGRRVFHELITYMRDRREHRQRWVDALRQSRVPLALINGSVDPVSGAHMVARFRELIGDRHFIRELPAIGHYPQVEAPAQTVAAYREFLAGEIRDHPSAGRRLRQGRI